MAGMMLFISFMFSILFCFHSHSDSDPYSDSHFSNTLMQSAQDFELPEVEQKLMHLKAEVDLPLCLLEYIDNHGTGMNEKKKQEKGEKMIWGSNAYVAHQ